MGNRFHVITSGKHYSTPLPTFRSIPVFHGVNLPGVTHVTNINIDVDLSSTTKGRKAR